MNKQTVLDQFLHLPPEVKLVVLHPRDRKGNFLVMKHLLQQAQPIVFVDCTQQDGSLSSLIQLLQEASDAQLGLSLPRLSKNAKEAGAQVGKFLGEQGSDLFIEGYDQLRPEVEPFVKALLGALPKDRRVIVQGRDVPMSLFEDRNTARMIPHNPDYMFIDHAHNHRTDDERVVIEVSAFGPGQASVNGQLVQNWDGALPKNLFFFFVDRAMLTRDSIFEIFWQGMTKQEATNVFHVTKRKINELLGHDLTVYGSGYYRIADNIDLHYDVSKMRKAVNEAGLLEQSDQAKAMTLYKQAITLYRGPFLSTQSQPWVQEQRRELQQLFGEALVGAGMLSQELGHKDEALGYYQWAVGVMPEREDVVRAIMSLYMDRGDCGKALDAYHSFETWVSQNLDLHPSAETEALAKKCRKALEQES